MQKIIVVETQEVADLIVKALQTLTEDDCGEHFETINDIHDLLVEE